MLKKYKKDRSGGGIYVIDFDDNGIADEEIRENIIMHDEFNKTNEITLYTDKNIKEKYIVIFYQDFPEWLIKSLKQIGKKPSDFGFSDQKRIFHTEIREKERKENLNKIFIELNKQDSKMLGVLKDIFKLINHKS